MKAPFLQTTSAVVFKKIYIPNMSLEGFKEYVEIARKEISQTKGPRLVILETYLEKAKEMLNVSKRKLKDFAKECGLCLANFTLYGKGLRHFLKKHRSQTISRNKAKQFEFVKFFLIKLY